MKAGTAALVAVTMIAFACNSLLTRLALGQHRIDAAAFTALRLGSGAAVLAAMTRGRAWGLSSLRARGLVGPLALFAYAAPFSLAYLRIGAAVGALVLFGAVQLTMIGLAIRAGERPSAGAWLGILLALLGLYWLVSPALARPDPAGVALMTIAGIAWGVYSIAGRAIADPLVSTARSFLWSAPLALVLWPLSREAVPVSGAGVTLAVVSGAVTSGLGYAVWYRTLPRLTVTQAAVAQLTVPIVAAVGAVALLGERPTGRLAVSGVAVLAGVGIALLARGWKR